MAQQPPKLQLHSLINPTFYIEVDERVIASSDVLSNLVCKFFPTYFHYLIHLVSASTSNNAPVDVDMSEKQLKIFVELHEHFPSPDAPADTPFTNGIFSQLTDDEYKELCWKANYLDSQRFLEAAGQYALSKMEEFSVPEIQNFLNIIDDYTPEERKAMEEHPLEFFTSATEHLNGLNGIH